MDSISVGMSLRRLKKLHQELGDQIRDADVRIANGDSGEAVEIVIDAGANTTSQESMTLTLSNEDMERDEVRDSVLVEIS